MADPRPSPIGNVGCTDPMQTERGFSLMEVIVATAIATIAVVGLAYTFGIGRSLINRYEIARAALAAAQNRLETLSVAVPADPALLIGTHTNPFTLDGQQIGVEHWDVTLVGATDSSGTDLKLVTVTINWVQGTVQDNIQLSRLFPAQ